MIETEIKILEIDQTKIKKQLKELKATCIKKVTQKDTFYKNSYTKNNNITVRIRDEGRQAYFTTKRKIKNSKIYKKRLEQEIQIQDPKKVQIMLQDLGLETSNTYTRKREYYKLYNCSVEIIKAKNIPSFLEIEGTIANIDKVAKALGYTKKEYCNKSFSQIYKEEAI